MLDKWLVNLQVLSKSLPMHWLMNRSWFNIWDISSHSIHAEAVVVKLETRHFYNMLVYENWITENRIHIRHMMHQNAPQHIQKRCLMCKECVCQLHWFKHSLSAQSEWVLITLAWAIATLFHESGFHMLNSTNNSGEANNPSKIALSKLLWLYLNWKVALWIFILNLPLTKTFDGIWSNEVLRLRDLWYFTRN